MGGGQGETGTAGALLLLLNRFEDATARRVLLCKCVFGGWGVGIAACLPHSVMRTSAWHDSGACKESRAYHGTQALCGEKRRCT